MFLFFMVVLVLLWGGGNRKKLSAESNEPALHLPFGMGT